HKAEIVLEEFAVGLDVHCQAVEVVDAPHVDAASRKLLRLVLERGPQFARWFVPFGAVVDLESVAVRILEDERLSVAEIPIRPSDVKARTLERSSAAFECLRGAGPERGMAETGRLCVRQLERIALIVVPAAQIDAAVFFSALRHPHYVDEKSAAVLEFRRQQLDMAEVCNVADRFRLHG